MSRVTSKLQVTIPKWLADRYGIVPGREIEWLAAGDAIRVIPPALHQATEDRARRLELFDLATERQRERDRAGEGENEIAKKKVPAPDERGWRREELYQRGSTG